MVKLFLSPWLQGGCVYAHTSAWDHAFYSLTLWAEILYDELASSLYK